MSSRSFQIRCFALCLCLVTGLSLLSVRLIQVQIWERKKYADRARAAYDRSEVLPGLRGKIVDRNDEVLATSIELSDVMVDAKLLRDPVVVARALAFERASSEPDWASLSPEEQASKLRLERRAVLEEKAPAVIVERHLAQAVDVLSRPLGLLREELLQRVREPMDRGRVYYAIARDVPKDTADTLRVLLEENQLCGFQFENRIRRWYNSPELATHVVGYTGEQEYAGPKGRKAFRQVGKFGVEAAMNEFLLGRDGVWDRLNLPMPGQEGRMVPPAHGLNVSLTLDMGVQAILEDELDAALREYDSRRGCIVVLEPESGELLGMVNRPHFDLNTKKGLSEGALNYALQGIYEPGSTFKVVAAAGALEDRLVQPQSRVYCHNGHYQEGKLRIPDHHPYGMLSVEGVLQKSSNIGAFKLARQLGTRRFFEFAGELGFGRETGILLSNESAGVVRNTRNLIDFSRASYGYAVNVTPLQIATAYAAIANGGEWVRPRVVRSVIANDGSILERYEREVVRRVMQEEIAGQMREALVKVVEPGGTATRAAVPGFRVAGKTGTALRIRGGRYQDGHYTVSFVGMMPADDPAFVCLVVIDDPLTNEVKRYGGTIAAPTFARVAARLATQLHLEPTEPVEETSSMARNSTE